MNGRSNWLTTLGLVALIGLASAACAQTYTLSGDFSTVLNPNSPWSYNKAGVPISAPITGYAGYGYLHGWGDYAGLDSSITKVTEPGDFLALGWNDLQLGDVVVHSASYGNGEMSIAWASPGAGMIDLSGAAWDALHYADRDSSWQLLVGGEVVAERATIFGTHRTDTAASFAENLLAGRQLTGLTVGAGELVELLTSKTAGSPYGHFVGFDLNVGFTAIPEPATYAAWFGAAALILAVVRRRRRS